MTEFFIARLGFIAGLPANLGGISIIAIVDEHRNRFRSLA